MWKPYCSIWNKLDKAQENWESEKGFRVFSSKRMYNIYPCKGFLKWAAKSNITDYITNRGESCECLSFMLKIYYNEKITKHLYSTSALIKLNQHFKENEVPNCKMNVNGQIIVLRKHVS